VTARGLTLALACASAASVAVAGVARPAWAYDEATALTLDSASSPGEFTLSPPSVAAAAGPVEITLHVAAAPGSSGLLTFQVNGLWQGALGSPSIAPCAWQHTTFHVDAADWNQVFPGGTPLLAVSSVGAGTYCSDGGAWAEISFVEQFDFDGDGTSFSGGDCNDGNAAIRPNAAETCNFFDDDCDGQVDELSDADSDGVTSCAGDCDDGNPAARPGLDEVCGDFVDNDCDGGVDNSVDSDGDGYSSCGGDCDDQDPAVHPEALELCNGIDDNCASVLDPSGGSVSVDEGCGVCDVLLVDDDNDAPDVRPIYEGALATEGWDWQVWDVPGFTDNGPTYAILGAYDAVVWFSGDQYNGNASAPAAGPNSIDEVELQEFLDAGGGALMSAQDWAYDIGNTTTPLMTDYFGVQSITSDVAGVGPGGMVYGVPGDPVGGPYSFGIHVNVPAGFSDFSDRVDASASASTAFTNTSGVPVAVSLQDPSAGVWRTIFLGWAWELSATPDAAGEEILYGSALLDTALSWLTEGCDAAPDLDGDGATAAFDCDDENPSIHPGAVEICDGLDDDCNGIPDDINVASPETSFFWDSDGDGAGAVGATPIQACSEPPGYAPEGDDCDDADSSVYPGAEEICGDSIDQDCDGADDVDLDGDGSCGDADPCPFDSLDDSDGDGVCDGQDLCDGEDDQALAAPLASYSLGVPMGGATVQPAGDVDGDGAPDFVLGGDGSVEVWGGGSGGPTLLAVLSPPSGAGPGFGLRVAAGGDVNGDGLDDIAVGDPDATGLSPVNAGRVLIYTGQLGSGPGAAPTYTVVGQSANERLGTGLATRGDLSGDGTDDLAVFPGFTPNQVRVHFGTASGPAAFPQRSYSMTAKPSPSLDISPDVNGDGIAELLVGQSPLDKVWVVLSPLPAAGPIATAAAAQLLGTVATGFGSSVRGLGDLDGDGFGDVAVGSNPGSGGAGLVSVFPGFLGGIATLPAITVGGGALLSVAADAADFDGDGALDLAVAALASFPGGAAHVFLAPQPGSYSPADADWTRSGGSVELANPFGGQFGAALASPGDVDGDGDPDLIVGAPGQQFAGAPSGRAYLFDVRGLAGDVDGDGLVAACDDCPFDAVADADGDGFCGAGDCDDGDGSVYPGAPEACDGLDSDCDGVLPVDEQDADGDLGILCDGSDCDDTDPGNFAANPETCDGADNDCNGAADAGPGGEADADLDGYLSCEDCDDSDFASFPGAEEICDGADNDCNGVADFDGGDELDEDADGAWSCEDCDDADPERHPENAEFCDGIDNDCSGEPDEDEVDEDGDGSLACDDCDDGDAARFPGAEDVCADGIDQDCDGEDASCGDDDDDDSTEFPAGCVDEIIDADGDGHPCDLDCDDENPDVYPGAELVCDFNVDTNCDGAPDVESHCGFLAGCACSAADGGAAPPLPAGLAALLGLAGAPLAIRRRRGQAARR
jgi:MYXO-CTERM domain-containing protein